jgi:hypothetical protein
LMRFSAIVDITVIRVVGHVVRGVITTEASELIRRWINRLLELWAAASGNRPIGAIAIAVVGEGEFPSG